MAHRPWFACALLLTACGGESIQDQSGSDIDTSTIGWEEPGAEPDQPLDASNDRLDAASPDHADSGVDGGDGQDGGAHGDAGESDAGDAQDAGADGAVPDAGAGSSDGGSTTA
jgi:hypothetical protein